VWQYHRIAKNIYLFFYFYGSYSTRIQDDGRYDVTTGLEPAVLCYSWWSVQSFVHNTSVWQTDGRTDFLWRVFCICGIIEATCECAWSKRVAGSIDVCVWILHVFHYVAGLHWRIHECLPLALSRRRCLISHVTYSISLHSVISGPLAGQSLVITAQLTATDHGRTWVNYIADWLVCVSVCVPCLLASYNPVIHMSVLYDSSADAVAITKSWSV